jgi:hypothetical protein
MPNQLCIQTCLLTLNKSVLNWTQVCQLHCKTQLHENIYPSVQIISFVNYRRKELDIIGYW